MNLRTQYFFFLLFGVCGCIQRESKSPEIVWSDNKATEIILSNATILSLSKTDLSKSLRVELGDTNEPMLGQFFRRDGKVVFQPVVPFSRGMHYHVLVNGVILNEVDIPVDESAKTPEVSIYPSTDTLPENTLKMYLKFTESMVEGKSYRHIHLLNSSGDTLAGTFLDLQPELWNEDGTVLTIWFDPGRVKRDLIPNKTFGNPIIQGNNYTMTVSGEWKSKAGKMLGRQVIKKFFVTDRDEKIPSLNDWTFDLPTAGSLGALVVKFPESLDFSLLQSTIQIISEKSEAISLSSTARKNEKAVYLTKNGAWEKGTYTLRVESRLEDLAGNNLLRPFDRDINKSEIPSDKKYFERKLQID